MEEKKFCPNCGAEIKTVEGESEYVFCPFCGARMNGDASRQVKVGVTEDSRIKQIQEILNTGWEKEQNKDYKEAEKYYIMALDLDPNIPSAKDALARVQSRLMDYNMTICVKAVVPQPGQFVYVTVLGKKYVIREGATLSFVMPVGVHRIGIARYSRSIRIMDSNTRVRIEFTLARKNKIDIFYN